MSRYKIVIGRWGAYIHDTEVNQDIDLVDIVRILNNPDNPGIQNVNDCPECGKGIGYGAGEWCYSCAVHEGLFE